MFASYVLLSISALAALSVAFDLFMDWANRRAWLKNPERRIGTRNLRRVLIRRQFNAHRTNMMGH